MTNINESDSKHSEHVNLKKPINDYACSVIRRVRIQKQLRVQDMALLADIPMGSYSCLETGRYRLSLDNLFRIMAVLNLRPSDVLPSPAAAGSDGKVTQEVVLKSVQMAQSRQRPLPEMPDVLDAVCLAYALDRKEIRSPSRKRLLTEARKVAAVLVQETPHLTLNELSIELRRHASSLSHFLKRMKKSPPDRQSDFNWQLEKARRVLAQIVSHKSAEARRQAKRERM